jgi:antitoxin (DNA-binding transcriptional repressor) of toxin-antitoxin stability system
MKTLTITDAKKNLGRWLKAAAQGEQVAIISGGDVIALRKVEVAAIDTSYAEAEYGATPESLERFERGVTARYQRQRKAGKLRSLAQVKAGLEKAHAH